MVDKITALTFTGSLSVVSPGAVATAARYDASRDIEFARAPTSVSAATRRGPSTMAMAALAIAAYLGPTVDQTAWTMSAARQQETWLVVDGRDQQVDRSSALAAELVAYRNLPEGWDGQDGMAPSKAAIDDALMFIDLLPLSAEAPQPMVSGEGEVGFFWRTENGFIDVSFMGDGIISYYGRSDRAGIEVHRAVEYNGKALPDELIDVIIAI